MDILRWIVITGLLVLAAIIAFLVSMVLAAEIISFFNYLGGKPKKRLDK